MKTGNNFITKNIFQLSTDIICYSPAHPISINELFAAFRSQTFAGILVIAMNKNRLE